MQVKSMKKKMQVIIIIVIKSPLTLKDKSILPEGYHWEEKGREFSYKGMFYDIVSIKQTKEGWVIKAASDEEEAEIVANQHKAHQLGKVAAI
jgi:hypothetical protein